MTNPLTNLYVGWALFLCGALSGAIIGQFFHRSDWLGGYDSFPRRLVRLGHMSFFGLGIINILFALSIQLFQTQGVAVNVASLCFSLGAFTMPLSCFLSAWKVWAKVCFVIPVLSVIVGISALLVA
jgi:hypothetical protein